MFKQDIIFDPPYMNTAGYCGFTPETGTFSKGGNFGAFVTNPISYKPRKPAVGKRFIPYPGGFLLHTGLTNPGFFYALKKYSAKWLRAEVPIILHMIAENPSSVAAMVRKLEEEGVVSGIELGFRHDHSINDVLRMINASTGELPIIARVSADLIKSSASAIVDSGAFAISLAAPRGLIRTEGKGISGRLQGPGLNPQTLQLLDSLQEPGLNLISTAWFEGLKNAEKHLEVGALAIQFAGFHL